MVPGLRASLASGVAALPWTGAALGAGAAAAAAWLAVSHALFWPAYGAASFLLGAAAGGLPAAGAGGLVFVAARGLHPGPAALAGVGVACGVLAALLGSVLGEPAPEAFAGVVAAAALVGAAAGWLGDRLGGGAALLLVLGAAAALGVALHGSRPGSDSEPALHADPVPPGPYQTRRFHYGSGEDRRRPEYGRAADRVTRSVDAADLLPGWSGLRGWLRSRWWGFGPQHLPLNGRAWVPRGEGPFPLVLVVHGNHPMERFSDAGYAYLAEHLASRGSIAVSVDQNFLNASYFSDLLRPWPRDLEVRAGLLLEHLALWRGWNATPGDPLHGRVDLGRVALVGHSRGGEAVALAALRDREPLRREGGAARFAHGFGVRAVVALAPVQGHARPDGEPLALEDLSYLILHGSHDGDLRSFEGVRQFESVRFTRPATGFKAAVWIEGANHNQFNRDWGATDLLAPLAPLVVRDRLLAPRQQERLTQILVGAFLEATLRGEGRYEAMFRAAGRAADTLRLTRYRVELQEAGFRVLADFEEDEDPTTASTPGGRLAAEGLESWREAGVERRWIGAPPATRAVHLGWQRPPGAADPHFVLELPPGAAPSHAGATLSFSLADADYARRPVRGLEPASIDLSIELEDAAGSRARLPLSRFGELRPLYDEPLLRPALFDPRPEIVFQSFELPLAVFREDHPAFDPSRLRSIRWVFDRTASGLLALDDVGWRAPGAAAAP